MILTCPTIHHGLMTPDGEGEWFCRKCGSRLYQADDQALETHPVDLVLELPVPEIVPYLTD